jgi:hypothetical protein
MSSGPHALKTQPTPHQLITEASLSHPMAKQDHTIGLADPWRAPHALASEVVISINPLVHLKGRDQHDPCQVCSQYHHDARPRFHPVRVHHTVTDTKAPLHHAAENQCRRCGRCTPLHHNLPSPYSCSKNDAPRGRTTQRSATIVRSRIPRSGVSPQSSTSEQALGTKTVPSTRQRRIHAAIVRHGRSQSSAFTGRHASPTRC